MTQLLAQAVQMGNTPSDGLVTAKQILAAVTKRFKLKADALVGDDKCRNIAHPRQIAMYLCRNLLRMSYPAIGQAFGGRDHTTVIHSCRKVEQNNMLLAEAAELRFSVLGASAPKLLEEGDTASVALILKRRNAIIRAAEVAQRVDGLKRQLTLAEREKAQADAEVAAIGMQLGCAITLKSEPV